MSKHHSILSCALVLWMGALSWDVHAMYDEDDEDEEIGSQTPGSFKDPIWEQVKKIRSLSTWYSLGQVSFDRVFNETMKLPVENNDRIRQLATLAGNLSRPLAYKHRRAAAEALPDDSWKEKMLQWLEKNKTVLDKPFLDHSLLDWGGYVRV